DDRVYFFEAVALPFGGVSAVTGFNRAARSLKLAMSRLLWIINTSYYDDFCQIEVSGLEKSAAQAAERFMALLGWEIARGDKLKPFSSSFNILGVTVSFDRSAEGAIHVSNKQERLPDLWKLLLQMESDPGLRLALEVLSEAGPREVLRWGEAPPVLVFTDGACEKDGALTTHGAVLLDPATGVQEFFGERMPDYLVQRWRGQGLKQLVFFAELLPVAVAKATWQHVLRNRLCIFFLDNEAARACLIRSFTPVANATSILMDVAKQDVASHSLNWYSREFVSSGLAFTPATGSVDVGAAVAFAHQSLPASSIKHCWEQGFWSQIFGPPRDPFEDMDGTSYKRPDAPLVESPEEPKTKLARSEVLCLWGAMLETWPRSLEIIDQLMQLAPESRGSMVEDLLGHKAPATLRKRYRSIVGYDGFLKSKGMEFPGTEESFYVYLCQMRDEGKPASSRKSLLEAITFVRFVLGMQDLKSLGESRRCHGSARQKDFRPRKQASPFSVDELSRLHLVLERDPEPWNRVMAGTVLLAVYGRTRWEDLEHAETLIVDRDSAGTAAFIEAGVGVHKTMGAKLMRGQLLPIVAPAVGVVESNWVEQYVQARSLESDEAGAWIRRFQDAVDIR
ncbi:unnamed protein product, partial [Symbiodinium necroappetens]